MASRNPQIILPNTEYSRYRAACELSRSDAPSTPEILRTLGDIVDLLDQQAFLEIEVRHLDSPPLLLLALSPDECNGALGPDEFLVLAVTRHGTLARITLRFDSESWSWQGAKHLKIPEFEAARDRILGLYWTRSTTIFRSTPDLILVTRQKGGHQVYLNRLKGEQEDELRHIGDHVPDWMKVCPVGAPVGVDLLEQLPQMPPPLDATAAVALGGKLYSALPRKQDGMAGQLEGEYIHCLGQHLILSHSPQTILCYEISGDTPKSVGRRRLTDKPVCFCPFPSIQDEFRLVIGHETGLLSLMVVAGKDALERVWTSLLAAVEKNEGVDSFGSWVGWASRQIEQLPLRRNRSAVAAILRGLLEKLPPSPEERSDTFNETVAQLFRQPLSFTEFLPVMQPLRSFIHQWRGDHDCHGAAVVESIYSHLPYSLQDLFDLELARHDRELATGQKATAPPSGTLSPSELDCKAYKELRTDWKITRSGLLAKKKTTDLARTALFTEQWLEHFVLERASPGRQSNPARVRPLPGAGGALVIHPSAIYLLKPDSDRECLLEIPMTQSFDASLVALVQKIEFQDSRLVVGDERRLSLLGLRLETAEAEVIAHFDLPENRRLILAGDAGKGNLLLLVTSLQQEAEIWLFSWSEGRILAKGTLEHRPRELVVLPSDDPYQWSLVTDVADEEIGLVQLSRVGETLESATLARRRLRGKVRSIAALPDPDRATATSLEVFVGTASGYVFGLQVPVGSASFELGWIYRLHGAVRHLHLRPFAGNPSLLALGAAGEAILLDRTGIHHWMGHLAEPLNSGLFLQAPGAIRLCLVDVEGNVRIYREMDSRAAWRSAQEHLNKVDSEQWREAKTARWELAEAMRLLVQDPPASWRRFSSLQTRAARACLLRRLGEVVAEEGRISPELRNVLPSLLEGSQILELRALARMSAGIPLPVRKDLVLVLLREVARRADQYIAADMEHRQEAEDLLAEMVNGLGSGFLRPSRLLENDLEAWWRIPEEVRRDLWVVAALLVAGGRAESDPQWTLSALIEQATFLGPRAFEVLPLIASPADAAVVHAIHDAIEHIRQDSDCSLECREKLRELASSSRLRAEALGFVRCLAFLARPGAEWAEFLATTQSGQGESDRAHPLIRHFITWSHPYRGLASPDVERAPVEDQIQDLEELASDHPSEAPSLPGGWAEWMEMARLRFAKLVNDQLDRRRKELRRRQWVRLEGLRVERLGPRIAAVRARLSRDGVKRHAARVLLHLASPDSGLRALGGELSASWAWDEVPEELEWVGFLDQGAQHITVCSETRLDAENYKHPSFWTAPVPPAERNLAETLLDQVPELKAQIVDSLQSVRKGVHLLALDEELGSHALASALLEAGGSLRVKLDEDFEGIGPGRADPAGFTADRLLQALEAHENAKGEWQVRRVAGRKRIVVFPAEETVARLLTPALRPVLEEVGKTLRQLDGLPILWILPVKQASALKSILGTAVRFRALHVLPEQLKLGESNGRSLEIWASRAASVGASGVTEALEVFGGNIRLFLKWVRIASIGRPSPQEFLRSAPAADECLREELVGVGPRELGDIVVARRSRTRLTLRELREGMKPLETIRSTVRKGAATEIIRRGEELTPQALNNLRSDPGAGKWPELWVEGYHPEGRNSDVGREVRPLQLALRRQAASIQQAHRQLAERQVLSVSGMVAHVRNPFRSWLDSHLELDPSGRTWVESLSGKRLFDSLTFEEMAATGDGLQDLCSELSRPAAELARELGNLRVSGVEPKRLENLCAALTRCRIRPLDLKTEAWLQPLSLQDQNRLASVATFFKVDRPEEQVRHFLGYWSRSAPDTLQSLADILFAQQQVVVTLFGPGLPMEGFAESRGLCILTDDLLKEVLHDRDISAAFWRSVRNRTGLRFFSPFQTQNALAEDSPVFVGREQETRRILEGLDSTSFLILGGRMIGKTSLLRHLYGRIATEGVRTVLFIDCAGCETAEKFWGKLQIACSEDNLTLAADPDPELAIEKTLRVLHRPVLFLNEIDGLSLHSWSLLQRLRGLSEKRLCQFVMVGYHGAFGGLHDAEHPFYHWVQGERGEKAFFLGPLSDLAARSLIAKLEQPPLEIRWENDQTRSQGYTHLIESTYRIPILLQTACQGLLERLDGERRMMLRQEDFRTDGSVRPVWKYLQQTRPALRTSSAKPQAASEEETYWGDLVLAATVDALFFRPRPAPIRDPKLRELPAERMFSFNGAGIQVFVRQALERLQLLPGDLQLIEERFSQESYRQFLDVMTLTVLVAPYPEEDRAYHFPGYIYPIELDRYLQARRMSIEDHILRQAGDLLEVLRRTTVTPA